MLMSEASSPASTGPAGGLFEGQVGAHYLLSLLVGGEPRGLRGTTLEKVACQRAGEGRFLDDVILHATDGDGHEAVLEIQVKRGVSFAPSDPLFRSIVGQIVKTSERPAFWTRRYELAIAISRTSHKIDGAYQDLLRWARQIGDAATFMNQVNRPGVGNKDMRSFVDTFRGHLRDFGAADDDEAIWRQLRRLQILVFDFSAEGSASEALAREWARQALHPDDVARAGALWTTLTGLALEIAAAAGDRGRQDLFNDLKNRSFRLAGDLRYATARKALADASRHALADIGSHVGGISLSRDAGVAAVRAALDAGRYVEIRGDSGVGKSALLKKLAEQIAAEGQIIILSPSRTIPKGWLAMKAALGFDGTARELLAEIAAAGGATLFVDSLDFYGEGERVTVIDLVREAATIPGFSVVATARRDFGMSAPNWLADAAISQLGPAETVMIDDLAETEVEELREASPELAALLADDHPARALTRNLFRLARLVNRPSKDALPRTEVEMARQWWESADGEYNDGRRDRSRVLRTVAEQALACAERLDVRDQPAMAVNALLATGCLRDLGDDRVAFRHDVLRDWAVANLLFSDSALYASLPLRQPAPASLLRGVELAARMAIELAADARQWHSVLLSVSPEGANGSWRRTVLLALVRSEIGLELLGRASSDLLDNGGQLLRELIRTVQAVEVEPASRRFVAAGVDAKLVPAGLNLPIGPVWFRLIEWTASVGMRLPAAAIPEVVELYRLWSMGFVGQDPVTPILLRWVHYWLKEIEAARNVEDVRERPRPFNGELTSQQLATLEADLRTVFLGFCHRTPDLAAQYVQSLKGRRRRDLALKELLKFSGSLAQGAPRELAELTAEVLINATKEEERSGPFREAFGFANLDFVPASPAQGPFLDLLVHAPEHGLKLIRQLLDHAIEFKSGGRDFGSNAIRISLLDGSEMVFPWLQSYNWSRDVGAAPAIVTSALMALEAWAHVQIEAGQPFERVLADVIGAPQAPAACLLVVVDILISHWPKSRDVAIPFTACPELLCLDQERSISDGMEIPDFMGLKAVQKEPTGIATNDSLKARASRRFTLHHLLGLYALQGSDGNREEVTELLRRAALRLGPPDDQSTLGDPRFMVVHALNLVDPNNWREVPVETKEGIRPAIQYLSPPAEEAHLKPLQDASRERQMNGAMRMRISAALDNPQQSSWGFADAALDWAQKVGPIAAGEDDTQERMRLEAIVTAGLIAARDGTDELITKHQDWIRGTFAQALKGEEDGVHRVRAGLRYNPIAIAFAGMVLLLKRRSDAEDMRRILEAAGDTNPAAAHGFRATARLTAEIDEKLPCSILRCAFSACIEPRRRAWNDPEDNYKSLLAEHRQRVDRVIDSEMAWLRGDGKEPDWPTFPTEAVRSRRRHRLTLDETEPVEEAAVPDSYADRQAAALWLGAAEDMFDAAKRPWLRALAVAYASWTYRANGAGLDRNDDVEHPPREWNSTYFKLLASCIPGLDAEQIESTVLASIKNLPDEAFFGVTVDFLRNLDLVVFDNVGVQDRQAVQIRSALAQRLMKSYGWVRHSRERSPRIETHLGPAVAVLFFNDYGHFEPAKCYLLAKGIDRLPPFLPVLTELAEGGSFLFVALVFLNLIEKSPRPAHLPLINAAAKAWLTSYGDDAAFWVESDIGRRLCAVMQAIFDADAHAFDAGPALRSDIDILLAALVRLGIAEAYRFEESLRRAV